MRCGCKEAGSYYSEKRAKNGKGRLIGCSALLSLIYSCDFSHDLHSFWNLFGVYESESAFRASPASNGHFLTLIDYARFCCDLAEDTLRIRHSSLRPAILFKIHWYASTDYEFSLYVKRVFVFSIERISLGSSFGTCFVPSLLHACLSVHYGNRLICGSDSRARSAVFSSLLSVFVNCHVVSCRISFDNIIFWNVSSHD